MFKILAVLLMSFSLSACMSGHYEVDKKAMDYTNFNFIGIPTVLGLGMSGSSTPISTTLSVTNKHVAYPLMKTVVNASTICDVAIIKQKNNSNEVHTLNYAKIGDKVTLYGYSGLTGLPVSSTGTISELVRVDGCLAMYVDGAGGVAGMSGGAIVNSNGEIVGIVKGLGMKAWKVIIIPVQSFREILPLNTLDDIKKRNPNTW